MKVRILETKRCTSCHIEKPLSEFGVRTKPRVYVEIICKSCANERSKAYRLKDPARWNATRKIRDDRNKEKIIAEKRTYTAAHREEKRAYDSLYRKKNRDKIAAYKKGWAITNKDDPAIKITKNLRRRVHHVLNGHLKAEKTLTLLGCTKDEFVKHLEAQFLPGMTWDNYGPYGWHIDHIKECRLFDMTDPNQQVECFHYTNQRPLWAKQNLCRPRPDLAGQLSSNNTSAGQSGRIESIQLPESGITQTPPT